MNKPIASMLTIARSKAALLMSPHHQQLLASMYAVVLVATTITGCGTSCEIYSFPERHDSFLCLACSPDGKTLVTGSANGSMKVWDVAKMELNKTIEGAGKYLPFGQINTVAYSSSGETVAVGCDDGVLHVMDTDNWKELWSVGSKYSIAQVIYAQGGQLLVSVGTSGDVQLWNALDGTKTGILEHGDTIIYALAASPGSGNFLATGDATGNVHIWNLKTMKKVATVDAHGSRVKALAFSPDGTMLASASQSVSDYGPGTLSLWKVKENKQSISWKGDKSTINSLAFPSSYCLISSDLSGEIVFWNTKTQKQLLKCEPRRGYPWAIAWCDANKKLFIGSLGGAGIVKIITPPADILTFTETAK